MGRIRQLREIILIRQKVEHRNMLTLEEIKARTLASAIHAAAGNAKGAKAASKIRFSAPDPGEGKQINMISTAQASRMFGPDKMLPPFSDEEIAAEILRQQEEKKKG